MEGLNAPAPFVEATSFLVSHFNTDTDECLRYFNEISVRLKPGAIFVNADIAADRTAQTFPELMEAWLGFDAMSGLPEEGRTAFPEMFGRDVAAHPRQKAEELIKAARFDQPIPFFQSLMIRRWFTRKQR
jgi:tRNA (cmo5U34)-methyltransferase